MKRIIEDTAAEGLEALLGERVTVWCVNYFYTGKLIGVNDTCIKLTDAAVVYDTGPLTDKKWQDAQPLPREWYVMLSAIESFGILK